MHRALILSTCLAVYLLSAAAHAQGPAAAPDTIFVHGRILSGEGLQANARVQHPVYVEALAISHGVVTAVGSSVAIGALAGPRTRTVDLHGAFAMPGFNDAHTHMGMAGRQQLAVNLVGTRSLAEMQARIRSYIAHLPPGTPADAWLTGGGWDHTLWPSKTLPTRQELDAVTGAHPAIFDRVDGHIAVANTAALHAAGIGNDTPDPQGGHFDHERATGAAAPHESGKQDPDAGIVEATPLTGIVREAPAIAYITKVEPPPSYATRQAALRLAIADALAHGVTSVQDFSDWDDWLVLEEMEHRGELKLRFAEWLDFNLPLAVLEQRRASHRADDPLLHLTQLKGFMDGSLGSRTAAMDEPYSDDPANSGIPRYTPDTLNQMAAARAARGFQLGFHAIGDRANELALDAFSGAEQAGMPAQPNATAPGPLAPPCDPSPDGAPCPVAPAAFRFRIEHAQVLLPADFARFRELGVISSMQPSHLLTDMAWAPARLGPERVHLAYAWHRFLDAGVPLIFGTDYPVEFIDPFRGLYAATTRRNEAGTATFDAATARDEVLTLPEAIYAYTQASAYGEFRERVKGRLAPGFVADLIVLDRDPLALPDAFTDHAAAERLLHTRVLATWVAGEQVYDATAAPHGSTAPMRTPPDE